MTSDFRVKHDFNTYFKARYPDLADWGKSGEQIQIVVGRALDAMSDYIDMRFELFMENMKDTK